VFGKVNYKQNERESDFINDGNSFGFEAGMEGHVSLSEGEYRGIRGRVSVGFDSAHYENQTFPAGTATIIRDENSDVTDLTLNATLEYLMSRKTSVELRYLRLHTFTFHGNVQLTDRVDLTFNHRITPRLAGRVSGFFEYDDPSGRLSQQAEGFPDLTGPYPNTTRFGAGAGLRYSLNEWADLDLNLEWERRNGRLTHYVNHRVTFGATIYLNALKPKRQGGPSPEM